MTPSTNKSASSRSLLTVSLPNRSLSVARRRMSSACFLLNVRIRTEPPHAGIGTVRSSMSWAAQISSAVRMCGGSVSNDMLRFFQHEFFYCRGQIDLYATKPEFQCGGNRTFGVSSNRNPLHKVADVLSVQPHASHSSRNGSRVSVAFWGRDLQMCH